MAWLKKLFGFGHPPGVPFKLVFARFRQLIDSNTRVLQLFTDAAEKQTGDFVFGRAYIASVVAQLFDLAGCCWCTRRPTRGNAGAVRHDGE
jgi:hypothetical protein